VLIVCPHFRGRGPALPWDTGAAVGNSLEGHTNSLAYSPDGRHFIPGSGHRTIRIWVAETGNAVGNPFKGHTYPVQSISYSPDRQDIASGSYDNITPLHRCVSVQSSSWNPMHAAFCANPDPDGWVRDSEGCLLGTPRLSYRPAFTCSSDNPPDISCSICFSLF